MLLSRRGEFVGDVLDQDGDSERLSKCLQMFDRGDSVIEFVRIEGFMAVADMLHEKGEG